MWQNQDLIVGLVGLILLICLMVLSYYNDVLPRTKHKTKMNKEEIFNNVANSKMKMYNEGEFKNEYKTLYDVIENR